MFFSMLFLYYFLIIIEFHVKGWNVAPESLFFVSYVFIQHGDFNLHRNTFLHEQVRSLLKLSCFVFVNKMSF